MSYERKGMGTNGAATTVATPAPRPEPRAVVPQPPEQSPDIEQVGRQMAQIASFLRPQELASGAAILAVPILAIPAIAGAFGGGDGHRLGGAAYGLVTGTVAGIVGYPLAIRASRSVAHARRSPQFHSAGIVPLIGLTLGIMAVPAYFAGKRAKGDER